MMALPDGFLITGAQASEQGLVVVIYPAWQRAQRQTRSKLHGLNRTGFVGGPIR